MKKRVTSKVMSSLLICSVVLACAPTYVFAQDEVITDKIVEGPTGGVLAPGEINYTQEELIEQVKNDNTLSQEQKDLMISKMDGTFEEELDGIKAPRTAYALNMTQYKQETSYYCGPASVYQTLKYFKVTTPSQTNLAKELGTTIGGTDGSLIPGVLNQYQTKNTYVTKKVTDQAGMQSVIDRDLSLGIPLIARVQLTTTMPGYKYWGYTTSGHFLNVAGQPSNQSFYKIVDPYYGYDNGPAAASYDVTAESLFYAINKHFAQHIYW